MKIEYKQVGVVILAILLTASGTLYLEKTGDYTNCRANWISNQDGTFTCPKTNVTNYCYEIEDRGSGWYRCWEGKPIFIEDENQKINNGRWICDNINCTRIE